MVAKLVESHADVDAADFQGRTPLHLAARGSAAVALALLEAGALVVGSSRRETDGDESTGTLGWIEYTPPQPVLETT